MVSWPGAKGGFFNLALDWFWDVPGYAESASWAVLPGGGIGCVTKITSSFDINLFSGM